MQHKRFKKRKEKKAIKKKGGKKLKLHKLKANGGRMLYRNNHIDTK